MFYTCSLDLAAACSPSDFLGIPAAVLSKSSKMLSACCSSDSVMVCFPSFKSPTTFEYSMADPGRVSLRSWLAASRAKTSVLPGREPDSAESVPDCGPTSPGSLARWNPSSCSWRTRQRSLVGGLIEFSETLPRWGTMRNGELFRRKTPSGLEAHRHSITFAKESGLSVAGGSLPTPGASKACNDTTLTCSGDGRDKPNKLGWEVASVGTPTASNKVRGDAFTNGRTPTIRELVTLPTPHSFSKDGKSNGPSGNELGRAVNLMTAPTPTVNGNYNKKGASPQAGDGLETFVKRVPTPRSADGVHAGVTATCTTKRRAANGQANLGEFVLTVPTPVHTEARQGFQDRSRGKKGSQQSLSTVVRIATPAAQDAKNSTLPVSLTDRDSLPGHMIRSGQEGSLNPDWVEWLMGWPIGWTSLEPIGDAFDDWLIATQLRMWHHVEPPIPRTAKDIPNRVARLKAIGNGQVPLAAWLAWTILLARLLADSTPVAVDNAVGGLDHL